MSQTAPRSREAPPEPELTRDFTVATFVVHAGRVLLLFHRKLRLWLPPGGHIDPHELPDEAAVREVLEEAGVAVELVGERGVGVDHPRQLVRPAGIQLETIAPGHEHIDLIYFARPIGAAAADVPLDSSAAGFEGTQGGVEPASVDPTFCQVETEGGGWYSLEEMAALGVPADVLAWARRAVAEVG